MMSFVKTMALTTIQKRVFWIIGSIVAMGVLIYLLALAPSFSAAGYPPQNFLNARQAAAVTSKQIVDLTNLTNRKIQEINVPPLDGKTDQVLSLIRDARATNAQAYQKAGELSQDLKALAESLNDVPSAKSRQIAYDAVATELSLTSEFITYTQDLNTFLDSLQTLVGANTIKNQDAVRMALQRVNEKAASVNRLNDDFNAKMRELDTSF